LIKLSKSGVDKKKGGEMRGLGVDRRTSIKALKRKTKEGKRGVSYKKKKKAKNAKKKT